MKAASSAKPVIDRGRRSRRELGAEGERRAGDYLESRGYEIVGRNVRAGGVEIDLIALGRGVVVFVEVKTRRGQRQGQPEEAIGYTKRRRLVHGALAWLADHRGARRRARFDVISWQVFETSDRQGESWRIAHWEHAFDARD